MGVRTKRRPTTAANAYWSDEDYHRNIKMMREDLLAAIKRVPMDGTLIISTHGIGTGLAQLSERAPKTYLWLEDVLDMLSSTDSIKSPTPMEVTA
jgi:predicted sulfurtransferase